MSHVAEFPSVESSIRNWVNSIAGVIEDQANSIPLPTLLALYPDCTPAGERWDQVVGLAAAINTDNDQELRAKYYSVILPWFQEHGIHDDYRRIPAEGTVEKLIFVALLSLLEPKLGVRFRNPGELPHRMDVTPWTFLVSSYAYMFAEWGIIPEHLDGLAELMNEVFND